MGCNDIEIRKSEFVVKTQFLSQKLQGSAVQCTYLYPEYSPGYCMLCKCKHLHQIALTKTSLKEAQIKKTVLENCDNNIGYEKFHQKLEVF